MCLYNLWEVELETESAIRKKSKNIWTIRRSLLHSYGLTTSVQLCSICNFEHTISRLILTYDLWIIEQKNVYFLVEKWKEVLHCLNQPYFARSDPISKKKKNHVKLVRFEQKSQLVTFPFFYQITTKAIFMNILTFFHLTQ